MHISELNLNGKSTPFFATRADFNVIVHEVLSARSVEFIRAGLFDEPTLTKLANIEDLVALEGYLVVCAGDPARLRAVPQRAGGQKFAVDQIENPHGVGLHVGGWLAEKHLVAGQIGTVGGNAKSDELYAIFATAIRKHFERIKSYFVGPEAVELLDRGARLSSTPKAPMAYDLKR